MKPETQPETEAVLLAKIVEAQKIADSASMDAWRVRGGPYASRARRCQNVLSRAKAALDRHRKVKP